MFYDKSFFTEDDVKSLDTMMEKAAAAGKKVSMDVANGWYLYSFYAGAGLNLSLADDGVNTVCNWNEAPGADVTRAVIDICKNPGFLALKDEEFTGKLKDGTLVAGVNGTWRANDAAEVWGDNYAACKLPTYTLNGEQVQMASFSGFKLIGVNPTALTLVLPCCWLITLPTKRTRPSASSSVHRAPPTPMLWQPLLLRL